MLINAKNTGMMVLVIFNLISKMAIAQTDWTKHPGNPVLDVGPAGSWDDVFATDATVVFNGTIYQMWYTGFDGTKPGIGYATSPDAISWTKHQGSPVLEVGPTGSWDALVVAGASILFDGAIYHMWYEGNASHDRLGYATSTDGISWTKDSANPVFEPGPAGSWDSIFIRSPSVLFDGTTFHMWYSGQLGANFRIGYATSSDGVNWTKHAGNPVLDVGPAGAWDALWAYQPSVIFNETDSSFHMWYTGRTGNNFQIGYATSPDGISWTKHSDNPVLSSGGSGSWDALAIFFPEVLFDGTIYRMWYSGADQADIERIGYATSSPPTGVTNETDEGIPERFVLFQNYPNPFNPMTVIRYQLSGPVDVELTIYNQLGQRVKTLVSKRQPAGAYQIQWDGRDNWEELVSSGVYLYRLKAGSFVHARKMVLLR